jgi:hypothetical protein
MIRKIEKKLELILECGMQGNTMAVYKKINPSGKMNFVHNYATLYLNKDDWGEYAHGSFEYKDFEEFWQSFTRIDNWIEAIPLFVHPDYKKNILAFLQDTVYELKLHSGFENWISECK